MRLKTFESEAVLYSTDSIATATNRNLIRFMLSSSSCGLILALPGFVFGASRQAKAHHLIFSALPLRSLRLRGLSWATSTKNRRDAGNAEKAQRRSSYHSASAFCQIPFSITRFLSNAMSKLIRLSDLLKRGRVDHE